MTEAYHISLPGCKERRGEEGPETTLSLQNKIIAGTLQIFMPQM